MADALADAVAEVAAEAAALAMTQWRGDFATWEKSPGDPVCEVDLSVNALIRDRLAALLPEAGWLSEETADTADRLARERVWVVDPIDGTRDFIRGHAGWAVSIALVERGRPVVAVLDAPARGEVWRAAHGMGATLNGVDVHVGDRSEYRGARIPFDGLPRGSELVAVEKPNSIALRIAMVAADRADLVATFRWGSEWDIAAAVLIAREAGAIATDAHGAPLAFNTPSAQAFGLLVATPGVHPVALERLRDRVRVAAAPR